MKWLTIFSYRKLLHLRSHTSSTSKLDSASLHFFVSFLLFASLRCSSLLRFSSALRFTVVRTQFHNDEQYSRAHSTVLYVPSALACDVACTCTVYGGRELSEGGTNFAPNDIALIIADKANLRRSCLAFFALYCRL